MPTDHAPWIFESCPTTDPTAPDVVVIATGGLPNVDWIEGNGTVVSSWDVLSGMTSLSGNVLVHGLTGRNTALAVADFLSEQGA